MKGMKKLFTIGAVTLSLLVQPMTAFAAPELPAGVPPIELGEEHFEELKYLAMNAKKNGMHCDSVAISTAKALWPSINRFNYTKEMLDYAGALVNYGRAPGMYSYWKLGTLGADAECEWEGRTWTDPATGYTLKLVGDKKDKPDERWYWRRDEILAFGDESLNPNGDFMKAVKAYIGKEQYDEFYQDYSVVKALIAQQPAPARREHLSAYFEVTPGMAEIYNQLARHMRLSSTNTAMTPECRFEKNEKGDVIGVALLNDAKHTYSYSIPPFEVKYCTGSVFYDENIEYHVDSDYGVWLFRCWTNWSDFDSLSETEYMFFDTAAKSCLGGNHTGSVAEVFLGELTCEKPYTVCKGQFFNFNNECDDLPYKFYITASGDTMYVFDKDAKISTYDSSAANQMIVGVSEGDFTQMKAWANAVEHRKEMEKYLIK